MIDLSGKRVLVTGGSRGIGAACCRLFARAGATVWVHYRRAENEARAVLDEARSLCDGDHAMHAADLADVSQVDSLFAVVSERWGGLDCLVANAGVWLEDPVSDLSEDVTRKTLDVNVHGVFRCVRRAVPLLAGADDANIVTISSTAGRRGEARYASYAAGKGAVLAATKSWAVELAPDVRVNSVAPGWVTTDMTDDALSGSAGRAAMEEIPLRRIADPDDVAGPVLFLASPLARHMTAAVLDVNGGSVR